MYTHVEIEENLTWTIQSNFENESQKLSLLLEKQKKKKIGQDPQDQPRNIEIFYKGIGEASHEQINSCMKIHSRSAWRRRRRVGNVVRASIKLSFSRGGVSNIGVTGLPGFYPLPLHNVIPLFHAGTPLALLRRGVLCHLNTDHPSALPVLLLSLRRHPNRPSSNEPWLVSRSIFIQPRCSTSRQAAGAHASTPPASQLARLPELELVSPLRISVLLNFHTPPLPLPPFSPLLSSSLLIFSRPDSICSRFLQRSRIQG